MTETSRRAGPSLESARTATAILRLQADVAVTRNGHRALNETVAAYLPCMSLTTQFKPSKASRLSEAVTSDRGEYN